MQDPVLQTLEEWRTQFCSHGAQEVVVLDLKAAGDRRSAKRVDNRQSPMRKTTILRRRGWLKSPRWFYEASL